MNLSDKEQKLIERIKKADKFFDLTHLKGKELKASIKEKEFYLNEYIKLISEVNTAIEKNPQFKIEISKIL